MIALFRRGVIIALTGYQRFLSPFLPRACRFFPSCSAYTREAVERYGILKGIGLGLRRLGRCHSWHPGGFDPVR